jgi:hypothetical protein
VIKLLLCSRYEIQTVEVRQAKKLYRGNKYQQCRL